MVCVIAEKPSVARSIASVLGANTKKDGYIEGNGYIISWCFGHLVGQAPPESYDDKYKPWELSYLPIIPPEWKYEVNDSGKKQFDILKKLMNEKNVTELVCATDAGREGECIFRYVYEKAECRKPFKRLWVSSLEEKAIKDGFNNLKPSKEYDNLFKSGECRAKADWLVGINFTRLFSVLYKANPPLSIGRVQTPTLAMICERENKINNFIKEKYFTVDLDFGTFSAQSERIDSEEIAKSLLKACTDSKNAVVTSVKSEEKSVSPPNLYDLTTLQREANRLFGYTAQQTLDTAQKLYEEKLITYPRTDSQFITDDMSDTVKTLVKTVCDIFGYSISSSDICRITNNKKVSDHHALIPTEQIKSKNFDKLSEMELNILMLVSTKLASSVSPSHKYNAATANITCADTVFTAKGKTILVDGWKAIWSTIKSKDEDKSDDKVLPELKENQEISFLETKLSEHFTQPPKHFTEDTLLSAMEKACDEDISDDVERAGLGTPATRAGIIENLISKFLIKRKEKNLLPTDRGQKLISLAPEDVKSPKLTSDWENCLSQIAKGLFTPQQFMADIEKFTSNIVSSAQQNIDISKIEKQDGNVIGICPRCGKNVVETPKAYSCEDKSCGFIIWKAIASKTLGTKTAAELLEKKKTVLIKGFKSKVGKEFSAHLILKDDFTVGFEFEKKK